MNEINLSEIFYYIFKRKYIIILFTIIAGVASVFYTKFCVTPMYTSTTTVLLSKITTSSNAYTESGESITPGELSLNSKLISTYSEIMKSRAVAEEVKEKLNLNISESSLMNNISVTVKNDTEMLKINVTNEDPQIAALVANTLSEVFKEKVREIYSIENVIVVDTALPASHPSNINYKKSFVLFAVVGFVFSCGILFVAFCLDSTIKSKHEVEELLDLHVIGVIPEIKNKFNLNVRKSVIVKDMPKNPTSESIRGLRTNIIYKMHDHDLKTFLFTSPSTQDGKSFIVSNLATAFSQVKYKVLIIDCDFVKSKQTYVFQANNTFGISQALEDKNITEDNLNLHNYLNKLIQETQIDNVYIIPSGVSSSTDINFDSKQMDLILAYARENYDVVLLDAPPINIVSDTMSLCKKADGVIAVSAIEKSKANDLLEMKSTIVNMGGNIIGAIVNRMPMNKIKEYAKGYNSYTSSNSLTITKNKPNN